jgi:SAM-dependent methyltransferase
MDSSLFSDSEVASLCLRDKKRTETFRSAIRATVRMGDVVVDAGAGSGILSLFAAEAGAAKVYAVEAAPALSGLLRNIVRANGYQHVIEVLQGDARDARLPQAADVVIAEMIDTWLLDEHQLPVLSELRRRGVIGPQTRVIPERYDALATFGEADFTFFGFEIPFPLHDFPDLDEDGGWIPIPFRTMTETVEAFSIDFREAPPFLEEQIVRAPSLRSGAINAVRLSAVARLCGSESLGETVAFNGAKICPVPRVDVHRGEWIQFRFSGDGDSPRSLAGWRCDQTRSKG